MNPINLEAKLLFQSSLEGKERKRCQKSCIEGQTMKNSPLGRLSVKCQKTFSPFFRTSGKDAASLYDKAVLHSYYLSLMIFISFGLSNLYHFLLESRHSLFLKENVKKITQEREESRLLFGRSL